MFAFLLDLWIGPKWYSFSFTLVVAVHLVNFNSWLKRQHKLPGRAQWNLRFSCFVSVSICIRTGKWYGAFCLLRIVIHKKIWFMVTIISKILFMAMFRWKRCKLIHNGLMKDTNLKWKKKMNKQRQTANIRVENHFRTRWMIWMHFRCWKKKQQQ